MVRFFSWMLVLCLFVATTTAQSNQDKKNNFTEGVVKYDIAVTGVSEEISTFLRGSTLSFYVQGDWSKTELAILAGIAKMQFICHPEASQNTLLMDIPTISEKTAVSFDQGQGDIFSIFRATSTKNMRPQQFRVQAFKNKHRRIAGHRCHRVEVATQNGMPIVLYVSDKIQIPENAQFPMPWMDQIGGFPLSMELNIEGALLRLTASDVSKESLMKGTFEVPSDYSMQPMDEFKDDIQEKLGIGSGTTRYGL